METYHDNWNACLLFRNKQLTKQLKEYQNASVPSSEPLLWYNPGGN